MNHFDPSYGYSLDQLLQISPPTPPADFANFWRNRYLHALSLDPEQSIQRCDWAHPEFNCYDLRCQSTEGFEIGGWLLTPKQGQVARGVVVGHGYGGRDGPDFHLPIANAAFLFPCFRGLARSRCSSVSDNPAYHVLHDIDDKHRYILGGCVEDLWLAVSVMLRLFPQTNGHMAYLGISFGGGIGALALPWDRRVQRAHFNVPSFGHHPLRLQLPTWGSAASVQQYQRTHGHVLDTLSYYDAASAALSLRIPVHVAAALADPVVAPPGQFSIYNALANRKQLFVLDQGHADYPRKAEQEKALLSDLQEFFRDL